MENIQPADIGIDNPDTLKRESFIDPYSWSAMAQSVGSEKWQELLRRCLKKDVSSSNANGQPASAA